MYKIEIIWYPDSHNMFLLKPFSGLCKLGPCLCRCCNGSCYLLPSLWCLSLGFFFSPQANDGNDCTLYIFILHIPMSHYSFYCRLVVESTTSRSICDSDFILNSHPFSHWVIAWQLIFAGTLSICNHITEILFECGTKSIVQDRANMTSSRVF